MAAKVAAVADLCRELAVQAPVLGGRFLLYGSAARGEMRHDSDVDLLLDFPNDASTTAAWGVAELACSRLGLRHDISPVGWCGARFLAHVLPEARPLP